MEPSMPWAQLRVTRGRDEGGAMAASVEAAEAEGETAFPGLTEAR